MQSGTRDASAGEQRSGHAVAGRGRAAARLAAVLAAAIVTGSNCRPSSTLPARLSDQEFWVLTASWSEPGGEFTHSDNLVSNEAGVIDTARTLGTRAGVYIGVGPEQNFTYIARARPAMAFIIDVRPENRSLHLLYKAIFEMSSDRAEFVSRLFSRERPAGLGPDTPVHELFEAYAGSRPQPGLREDTGRLIRQRLQEVHKFPLSARDVEQIDYVLGAFYSDGPDIHYARLRPQDPPGPSYRTLVTAKDLFGQPGSYLATEEAFGFVKELQTANVIVPVVGDFAGPTALPQAAAYVRRHGQVVSAFYASNVEVYLNRAQAAVFCGHLAALPYDWRSWFIGSRGKQPLRLKLATCRS